jgi:hypothetical protein
MYDDYFHPRHRFDKMIDILKSEECKTLKGGYEKLGVYLEEMFETHDVDLLLYTLKHGKKYDFDIVYKHIMIKRTRFFTGLKNKYEDWAMYWLCSLYH